MPDPQFIVAYDDGSCSQAYLWRDQAEWVADLHRRIGSKRPIGIIRVTPKPRQRIANNWGKPRRR